MTFSAEAMVAGAKRDVGYHEGANNFNRYSQWQYGNPNEPWCASAACFWAVQDGGFRFPDFCTYGYKGEAYCPTMVVHAQQMTLWREPSYRAQAGDFVLYSWDRNGVADHIEVVLVDDGTHVLTIGGNTSDGVYYRTRDRAFILGFVALTESSQVIVPPPPPPEKVHPMFKPALNFTNVVDTLARPTGGCWLLHADGRVTFIGEGEGNVKHGGMLSDADRKNFQGRIAARLEPREAEGGRDGYTIIATSGEKYVPSQTH